MGIPNEPFICPSLARGIRRAYLESLDRHWAIFMAREKSDALRNPYLHLRTHKAYMREIERIRSRLMPRFLSISDMRVSANRSRTPSLNHLTGSSETSVSMNTGLNLWRMPGKSSTHEGLQRVHATQFIGHDPVRIYCSATGGKKEPGNGRFKLAT